MTNPLVRAATAVEHAEALDTVDRIVSPALSMTVRSARVRSILHGHWLGHALHRLLTDFPLGMWLSGTLLDIVGGRQAAPAAPRQRVHGRRARGAAFALAGGLTATAGGFFGGHLTEVRKVSSRHPSFEHDGPTE